MIILYRIYQALIFAPIFIILTLLTSIFTALGCIIGNGNIWGYYPGKIWSWLTIRLLFLPIKVEGREHLKTGQSYVFVANHQGAFDIFIIYGFLQRNFKWMMKHELRHIPFVGYACKCAHHIFVYRQGTGKIRKTYEQARNILREGMSLVVFPEGARTFTGRMRRFQRGAFALADELRLPVVPLTINGSFQVMPRNKDFHFAQWHALTLTIHPPIPPQGQGRENEEALERLSYQAIQSALEPKYRADN